MYRVLIPLLLAACPFAFAGSGPSPSETDGFDVDTENWTNGGNFNMPVRIMSGGPGGASDPYLQITSAETIPMRKSDAGAKGVAEAPVLVAFNRAQWIGDYGSTGSGPFVFSLQVNNTGSNPLTLRFAIGSGVGQAGTWYVTDNANAVALAVASGWTTVAFSTEDMVLATDSSGSDPLSTVLSGVASVRILHSTTTTYGPGIPDEIDAQVGVDNVQFSQVPVELQQFSVE